MNKKLTIGAGLLTAAAVSPALGAGVTPASAAPRSPRPASTERCTTVIARVPG